MRIFAAGKVFDGSIFLLSPEEIYMSLCLKATEYIQISGALVTGQKIHLQCLYAPFSITLYFLLYRIF